MGDLQRSLPGGDGQEKRYWDAESQRRWVALISPLCQTEYERHDLRDLIVTNFPAYLADAPFIAEMASEADTETFTTRVLDGLIREISPDAPLKVLDALQDRFGRENQWQVRLLRERVLYGAIQPPAQSAVGRRKGGVAFSPLYLIVIGVCAAVVYFRFNGNAPITQGTPSASQTALAMTPIQNTALTLTANALVTSKALTNVPIATHTATPTPTPTITPTATPTGTPTPTLRAAIVPAPSSGNHSGLQVLSTARQILHHLGFYP
ncbi:MAG TPA: hypothetical protein PLD47_16750 [Aggregatilineales bacterium]|nr:hypothetical protein [Anaerolineales bacterium]HRE49376.1 hypothetical protein [Aggregatilineales bacterium]